MKEQLLNYLNSFKFMFNIRPHSDNKIKKVEVITTIKPSSSGIPSILEYLNHPPYSDRGEEEVRYSIFVEIWVDEICLWRRDIPIEDNNDIKRYEDELIQSIMTDIIICGLDSAFHTNQKFQNEKR